MYKYFGQLLLVVSVFGLAGCASYFKRKECEKTNWFDYGYKTAMKGKRLQGDGFLQQCEKVEAEIDFAAADQGFKAGMGNYCKPEIAFQTGRKGEFFNKSMCDVGGVNKLVAKHAEGVEALCQPQNGKAKGATGWKYNNICPKHLEKGFLSTYNKGRKIFLNGQVKQKRSEIRALDRQIGDYNRQKKEVTVQLTALTFADAVKGSAKSEEVKQRQDSYQRQINDYNRKIRSTRTKQSQLRKEIYALEAEAQAL